MDDQPVIETADADQAELYDYWTEARRPLVCLAFLAPLLLIYELGILWLGGGDPGALRNGADFWMRRWLQDVGFSHAFLLPALVAGSLFAWHLCGKHPWRLSSETLVGMLAESLLFAFCLVLLGQIQDLAFQELDSSQLLSIGPKLTAVRMISFVGAGVYEEVLFRLCLLPVCFVVLRILLLPRKWAAVMAVVATSVLFAGAHYVGAAADQFTLFSFTFRMLAGLFFAALFMIRGFGITVGCHAAYDVLVGILLLQAD